MSKEHLTTAAIHADDKYSEVDVAPAIHVSTTFHYPDDPNKLVPVSDFDLLGSEQPSYVYSRIAQPNVVRAEQVLSTIIGNHAVLYSSGLSAFYAVLVHLNPKKVFIGGGYHGCHGILSILERNYGTKVLSLEDVEAQAEKGDVVHVETPVNPYGIALDLKKYVALAHAKGAIVTCDATFAPPPLCDPFKFGVDIVMHSATKYFGGHSDVLAGVLAVKDKETAQQLKGDRLLLGSNCPTLEAWLLLRSARTFVYRVKQQAESANLIVKYLSENLATLPKLSKIYHASLQTEGFVKEQLPSYGPAVFAIETVDEESAKRLPSTLKFFNHATSLGGVESLIEWRRMSDDTVPPTLLRISVGLEDAQDLIDDLVQALK